jgi:hypothetical protein
VTRYIRGLTPFVAPFVTLLVACGGGGSDAPPGPVLVEIAPALAEFAPDAELYQVSATLDAVEIVAVAGDRAVGYRYADGALSEGEPLGPADGFTFGPADVAFDPDLLLAGIAAELDRPVVARVDVIAGPDGLVYSAEVLSDRGGVLLVDLAPDGRVRGVVPAG